MHECYERRNIGEDEHRVAKRLRWQSITFRSEKGQQVIITLQAYTTIAGLKVKMRFLGYV